MAAGIVQSNLSTRGGAAPVEEALSKSPAVHPFKLGDFRRLWAGTFVSLVGDQFYLVALPWLVLQITGSSLALGAIMMVASGPRAVFMLVGGAATDRSSPRRILLNTAWIRALLVLLVGLVVYTTRAQLWELYVLAAAFGCADAFAYPAGASLLPSFVEKEQLPAANSLMMAGTQMSLILGPLAAGLVVRRWGIAWAFFADALSFAALIVALARLREKKTPIQPAKASNGMRGSIAEGLRYVADKSAVRSLILLAAVVNFCLAGPLMVGLATLARERSGSISAFGVFIAVLAVGSLAGVLGPALMKHRPRHGVIILTASTILGLGMVSLGVLHAVYAIAITLAVMGMASGWVNVSVQAWLQAEIDRAFLGRVVSLLMFALVGLAPLSYIVAGALLQVSLWMMFGVAGLLVLAIVAFAARPGSMRSI